MLYCVFVQDGEKHIQLDDGSLRVSDVQLSDNGTYECRAEVVSHDTVQIRHVHLSVLC